MKIVICGSVKTSKEEIQHVQRVLNSILPASHVTTPIHEGLQQKPLLAIQAEYAKAIHDADLVVIVPKKIEGEIDGGTDLKMDIGESTTYEMAVARYAMKPVIFWPDLNHVINTWAGDISVAKKCVPIMKGDDIYEGKDFEETKGKRLDGRS